VTLEAVTVPLLGSSARPDSAITRWTDSVFDDIPSAFFLRLFYVTDDHSIISGRSVGEFGQCVNAYHSDASLSSSRCSVLMIFLMAF